MITYVVGNLLESPARVLVNTVNTVGVMGKGIAKDFKTIYPEMFREYQKLCETGQLTVGKLWLYKTPNKWVLNFPTKTTWRQPSRIEYVEGGLKAFVEGYAKQGITSIAFPPLGCGNGELDWERQVRPLMEKCLSKLPIDIFIHLYRRDPLVPEHKDIAAIADWLRSEPESLAFTEVWHDLTKLIKRGMSLQTLTDKRAFRVDVVLEPEAGLRIRAGNEEHFVPQEKLIDLWGLIRTYGFCMERIMPGGLEHLTEYLVALFSKLPYCRPVHVAVDYAALKERNNIGLQWVPQSVQLELFRRSPVEVRAV
jgi:O-acetyl-ADP-ribose deacetylase (regulator of RNase III)